MTVYQLGWRARWQGGKRPRPARDPRRRGQRIEEHGLHIWFGFYEHAFRMLRGAYEEAGLAAGETGGRSRSRNAIRSACTSSEQTARGLGRRSTSNGVVAPNVVLRPNRDARPSRCDRAHDPSARDRPADRARCQGAKRRIRAATSQASRGWPPRLRSSISSPRRSTALRARLWSWTPTTCARQLARGGPGCRAPRGPGI